MTLIPPSVSPQPDFTAVSTRLNAQAAAGVAVQAPAPAQEPAVSPSQDAFASSLPAAQVATGDAARVAHQPQQVVLEPAPSLQEVALSQDPSKRLRPGHQGPAVHSLQNLLSSIGLLISGPPSKSYGPAIEAAVVALQRQEGLPETGEADPETVKRAFSRQPAPPDSPVEDAPAD
ncbi:MAG: peptidoglycan-binding domain-containing protein [Candidatus Sericytochromatia bacterium]